MSQEKFIVVTNPNSYDCAVTIFDNSEEALKFYGEFSFSNPIMAQIVEVKLAIVEKGENDGLCREDNVSLSAHD